MPDIRKDSKGSGFLSGPAERRFESCLWMTVKELATADLVTVHEDTSIDEIFSLFVKNAYHIFPVINRKHEFAGIVDLENL